MRRFKLPETIIFNNEYAQILTLGLYDGDRPSYNYLPEEIIRYVESKNLKNDLSFIFVQNPSLTLVGFILVKEENYDSRPKGVRIYSIGYVNKEVFDTIVNQLKFNLAVKYDSNNERLYEYIWGLEYIDYSFLQDDFLIDSEKNIFIAELT